MFNFDVVNGILMERGYLNTGIDQRITYNSYNKAIAICEGSDSLAIVYGPDKQRAIAQYYVNSSLTKTIYYFGDYEMEVTTSDTIHRHYVRSTTGIAALKVKNATTDSLYYTGTDHLGSIIALYRNDGSLKEQYSFDAWGRRRNPANWSYNNVPVPTVTERGFTGHEHLDDFGLINMNGRLYDPVLGRFLNADPVIQFPGFTQSYNSYSYVMNNPLRFTDPTGYTASTDAFIEAGLDNRSLDQMRAELYGGLYFDVFLNSELSSVVLFNGKRSDLKLHEDGTWTYNGSEILKEEAMAILHDIARNEPANLKAEVLKKATYLLQTIHRIRNNLPPDAISVSVNIDIVGILGADMSFPGKLLVLQGNDRGKTTNIFDFGIAGGLDIGATTVITSYYFVGNIQEMSINDFQGRRWAFNLGFSLLGIELGGGYLVAPVPGKGYIIGKMFQLGGSPPGLSGNINIGTTIFY
jgi:RHS repeat-associated protein